jgi:toxin CcdB
MPRHRAGYVVDIQANRLAHLGRRVVVPLLPADSSPAELPRLNPVFDLEGIPHLLATHLIASVPVGELGLPVGDLYERQDEIAIAMEVLLKGFPWHLQGPNLLHQPSLVFIFLRDSRAAAKPDMPPRQRSCR